MTDLETSLDPALPTLEAPFGRGAVLVDHEGRVCALRRSGSPQDGRVARPQVSLARLLAGLAALGPDERAAALAALVELGGEDPSAAEDLARARDALRERHQASVISPTSPDGVQVESMARLDRYHWLVQGWMGRHADELEQVRLLSPLGHDLDITRAIVRHARLDVDEFYGRPSRGRGDGAGFVAVVEVPHHCPTDGFVVQVRPTLGPPVEAPCPTAERDPSRVREIVLGLQQLERHGDDALTRLVVHPAVQLVEAERRRHVGLDTVDRFGTPRSSPEVSVVVPLYGRLDFLELQLAQWVLDPAMREADLVYVLDQPEQAEAFRAQARRLARLYDVPFTLATVTRNAGFSGANNLGVTLARGRRLLLCNSDVLPARPGWLAGLTRAFDTIPAVGAVSPRLLYEDRSLQHAGMYFDRPAGEAWWANEHYFKGLRGDFAPALVTREVPAVTGACMLVDTATYLDLGGLADRFVQGDFEDSDLCLRLRERGLSSWYVADVSLYHLEAMSYPSGLRSLVGRYNRWLHTDLWDTAITEVMSDPRFDSRPNGTLDALG